MRLAKSLLLLILFTSLNAQECCFEQPNKYAAFWSKNAPLIGGTLFGAGAGAIAGIAFSKTGDKGCCGDDGKRGLRGPRGFRGEEGPRGAPFFFPRDRIHSLTIDYSLYLFINEENSGEVTVTPFVTLPNQQTIEATPETYDVDAGGNVIDIPMTKTLHFPQVYFGNYEIGVRVENTRSSSIDFATVELFLAVNVTASRDGSITTLTNSSPAANNFVDLPFSDQGQTAVLFTYDREPPGTIP